MGISLGMALDSLAGISEAVDYVDIPTAGLLSVVAKSDLKAIESGTST